MTNSYLPFRINILNPHNTWTYIKTRPQLFRRDPTKGNASTGEHAERRNSGKTVKLPDAIFCNTNFLNSSDSCAIRTGDSVTLYNAMQDTEATAPESYRSKGRQCGAQTSAKPNPSPSLTLLLRTAG